MSCCKQAKGCPIRLLAILMMTALPLAAFAAGSDDTAPPTPTQTSKDCKDGEIWDEKTSLCVAPETTGMNNDQRFLAVRELAYTGRLEDGLAYYAEALAQTPDNIQARSYLGQAYVEMNELVLASAELDQIRPRGGGHGPKRLWPRPWQPCKQPAIDKVTC